MLEPWIIEQIRRREEEARRQNDRPRLDVPLEDERWEEDQRRKEWERRRNDDQPEKGDRHDRPDKKDRKDENPDRGVVIIDFGIA